MHIHNESSLLTYDLSISLFLKNFQAVGNAEGSSAYPSQVLLGPQVTSIRILERNGDLNITELETGPAPILLLKILSPRTTTDTASQINRQWLYAFCRSDTHKQRAQLVAGREWSCPAAALGGTVQGEAKWVRSKMVNY